MVLISLGQSVIIWWKIEPENARRFHNRDDKERREMNNASRCAPSISRDQAVWKPCVPVIMMHAVYSVILTFSLSLHIYMHICVRSFSSGFPQTTKHFIILGRLYKLLKASKTRPGRFHQIIQNNHTAKIYYVVYTSLYLNDEKHIYCYDDRYCQPPLCGFLHSAIRT